MVRIPCVVKMKCSTIFLVLLLSVLYFVEVQNKKPKIPKFLKICKRNVENLDKCIIDAIDILKPRLAVGIPEMKLPSFNPLVFPEAKLITPTLNAEFTDTKLYEADKFDLKDLHFDLDQNTLSMNISYEKLHQTGNYHLMGRLLTFQIDGKGYFVTNYTQIDAYAKLSGKRTVRKEKEYLYFDKIDYLLKFGDFKTQLDDLFVGNPELTRTTNRILNENSQSLLPDFEELCRSVQSENLFISLRRVFKMFPLDDLIPKE